MLPTRGRPDLLILGALPFSLSEHSTHMRSYAECWLGSFYVGSTKNDVDPGLMQLFRSTDKKTASGKKEDLPFQIGRWAQHVDDDEDLLVTFYRAPASVVNDRLELIGYTLDTAKAAFTIGLRAETAQHLERARGEHGHLFQREARLLEKLDVEAWLAALMRS